MIYKNIVWFAVYLPEVPLAFDLLQATFVVHVILSRFWELLDCDLLLGGLVNHEPDDCDSSFSQNVELVIATRVATAILLYIFICQMLLN